VDSRPDRGSERQPCGICGNATTADCHTGRFFTIGITQRGSSIGSRGNVALGGACRATIEDRYEWDHTTPDQRLRQPATRTAIVYRGACLGCGWAGREHPDDQNAAVEDAHDHTLPSWRELPIVQRHHHDANAKTVEKWAHDVATAYAAYNIDAQYAPGNGGVIRTLRQPMGTRSHHVVGLDYYDLCAGTRQPQSVPAAAPTQAALF
jgi:hypothetical protein